MVPKVTGELSPEAIFIFVILKLVYSSSNYLYLKIEIFFQNSMFYRTTFSDNNILRQFFGPGMGGGSVPSHVSPLWCGFVCAFGLQSTIDFLWCGYAIGFFFIIFGFFLSYSKNMINFTFYHILYDKINMIMFLKI